MASSVSNTNTATQTLSESVTQTATVSQTASAGTGSTSDSITSQQGCYSSVWSSVGGFFSSIGSCLYSIGHCIVDTLLCAVTLGYVRLSSRSAGATATQSNTGSETVSSTATQTQTNTVDNTAQGRVIANQAVIQSPNACLTDKLDALLAIFETAADDTMDQVTLDQEVLTAFDALPLELRNSLNARMWRLRANHEGLDSPELQHNNQFAHNVIQAHPHHVIIQEAINAAMDRLPKAHFRTLLGRITDENVEDVEKAQAFREAIGFLPVAGDLTEDEMKTELGNLFEALEQNAEQQATDIKNAFENYVRNALDNEDPELNDLLFNGEVLTAEAFAQEGFARTLLMENPRHETLRTAIDNM